MLVTVNTMELGVVKPSVMQDKHQGFEEFTAAFFRV